MTNYTQLGERERTHIFNGLKERRSLTEIAQRIGRNKSTVSRELKRNSDLFGYLYPETAQILTNKRKARHGSKIDRNEQLKTYIMEKMQNKWSPIAIAGRWSLENPNQKICAETVYQFIYHPKNKRLKLWDYLSRAKKKRGIIRKQRSVSGIMKRVSIHERPNEINSREQMGHCEVDLMFNSGSRSANVLTVVERTSRMVTLVKHESKHSQKIIESIDNAIGSHALSCTFDNGKEFALHHKLDIPTFFCDPGSPWQKGSVENMNGQLRRYIPFSLNAHLITQDYLDEIAHCVNNIPRKILGFLTPIEVFTNNKDKLMESRVKLAQPATEVSFNQNLNNVALHS